MISLRPWGFCLVVFLTGSAILVVEVAGIRALSPYFGSTIYSVTSVLCTVLAALSAGYWVGGRVSDRWPSVRLFFSIILCSGLSLFIVFLLLLTVLPATAFRLSIVSGPLIVAGALFFVPNFFLGMLSPFAIRLLTVEKGAERAGSVAGGVFFWSTLGSIGGSLLSGFVLIPSFSIPTIFATTSVLLAVLGYMGMFRFRKGTLTVVMTVLFLFSSFFLGEPFDGTDLVNHNGRYARIRIYDGERDERPVRFFDHDRSRSGAQFLDTGELVYDYTKYYRLYELFSPDPESALIIGGGAYSVPRQLLLEEPGLMVDVVEVEPDLFDLAKRYFDVPETDRLANFVTDGRRFLHDTDEKYDLIFHDVYNTVMHVPFYFLTREFFELGRERLTDDGVFVANVIGSLTRKTPSLLLSAVRTFQSVFPESYVFAVQDPGSLEPQNFIFVGIRRTVDLEQVDMKGLAKADPVFDGLAGRLVDVRRFDFDSELVLTDNYAPTEFLMRDVLHRTFLPGEQGFDGTEALADIRQLVDYGPRYLTALAHDEVREMLSAELKGLGAEVTEQRWAETLADGRKAELTNVIGRFFPDRKERLLLSAHYDSRRYPGKGSELDLKGLSTPGANDNASGIAVLIEAARYLRRIDPEVGFDLVFMDGEEGDERLDLADWQPLGANYLRDHVGEAFAGLLPQEGIVVDMVCDKDLDLFPEQSSLIAASEQVRRFWDIGRKLAPQVFFDDPKWNLRADHTALNEAGIPTFLVIDYDYEGYHSSEDTVDRCGAESLQVVGDALVEFVKTWNP